MEDTTVENRQGGSGSPVLPTSSATPSPGNLLTAQAGGGTCGCSGGSASERITAGPPSYIYALGRIEPHFRNLSLEKEFAQATGRTETSGLTDKHALQTVLAQRSNRYLVRQLCWVFSVENVETYVLYPRDPADFDSLVESLRPAPRQTDVDVVVGVLGPMAPPEMCNGRQLRLAAFDQVYSFDVDALIKSIPRPEKIAAKEFSPAAEEMFTRIQQMADNAGATDEHRALNYLAVRYSAIYAQAAEMFGRNYWFKGFYPHPSRLASASGRKIVDVIFTFTSRTTDVDEKWFVRVDVTDEFPFLVTKLSPYFDR
jgi:hypothetical protein